MAFLFNMIAGSIIGWISVTLKLPAISSLYGLAALLPGLGLCVRRLHDGGKQWTYILVGLIPIAGAIMLIVQLCKPSIPDDGTPTV